MAIDATLIPRGYRLLDGDERIEATDINYNPSSRRRAPVITSTLVGVQFDGSWYCLRWVGFDTTKQRYSLAMRLGKRWGK